MAQQPRTYGPRERQCANNSASAHSASINASARMRGTATSKQVAGDLTGPDRKRLEFNAASVPAAGDAGLYRSEAKLDGEEYVGGWIVDQDELVVGAVGVKGARRVVTLPPGKAGANLNAKAPALPLKVAGKLGATGNVAKLNGLSPNKQGPKQVAARNPVLKGVAKGGVADPGVSKKGPDSKKSSDSGSASPGKSPGPGIPLSPKKDLPGKQPVNDPPAATPNPAVDPMPVKKGVLPKSPGNDPPPDNPAAIPPPDVGPAPMPKLPGKVMPIKPKDYPPGQKPPPDQGQPGASEQPPADPMAINPPAEGDAADVKQTKIDDAVREENLQSRSERFQQKGGSPFLAAFLQQVRRSLTGTQPVTPLETRIGEALAAVPKESLQQFVARFDQLPEADRKALLGPLGDTLTPEAGLSDEPLDKLRQAIAAQSPKKPDRGAAPVDAIKKVQLGKLNCIRETPPSGVGSDDVLLIRVAASGRSHAVKVSEPIRNLDTGANRPLTPADGSVWPPAEDEKPAGEEISVVVGVLEDDSGNPQDTAVLLRAFAAATQAVAEDIGGGLLDFDLTDAMADGFDAFAAALPAADFLGVDKGVVQTDGKLTSANGTAKTKFSVQQKGGNGKLKSQYDLTEIKVEK